MIGLQSFLADAGLDSRAVNVLLHSPGAREGDLALALPGLVRTRRAAMEVYQATHFPPAERALSKGRPWVASFVKVGPGRGQGRTAMLFAGLYANNGGRPRPRGEIETDPEVLWLHETFGSFAELNEPGWTEWTWFDLVLSDRMADLQGRLVLDVRLSQTYVRLAENLEAPLLALHQQSAFDAPPPAWREMRPSAGLLRALPQSWAAKLEDWRGIYLVVDESDGARYVGSAYGATNLLGRWQAHVAGDAGVTAQLQQRNPVNFRFAILERVSPDMPAEDVIRLERTWMDRLHTVRYGLNT